MAARDVGQHKEYDGQPGHVGRGEEFLQRHADEQEDQSQARPDQALISYPERGFTFGLFHHRIAEFFQFLFHLGHGSGVSAADADGVRGRVDGDVKDAGQFIQRLLERGGDVAVDGAVNSEDPVLDALLQLQT